MDFIIHYYCEVISITRRHNLRKTAILGTFPSSSYMHFLLRLCCEIISKTHSHNETKFAILGILPSSNCEYLLLHLFCEIISKTHCHNVTKVAILGTLPSSSCVDLLTSLWFCELHKTNWCERCGRALCWGAISDTTPVFNTCRWQQHFAYIIKKHCVCVYKTKRRLCNFVSS